MAFTKVLETGLDAGQTCTSGTDVRYKVTWANQVSGSKSAQVYGVGINY